MAIRMDDGLGFEFDGRFNDAGEQRTLVECIVSPPVVGGDRAKIEMRFPNSSNSATYLRSPFAIVGEVRGTCKIFLNNVWYRHYTQSHWPRRETGSTPIELSHVGELKIIRSKPEWDKPVEGAVDNIKSVRFHLSENEHFVFLDSYQVLSQALFDKSVSLYKIEVPQLGPVHLMREWVFNKTSHGKGQVYSGLCALVEFGHGTSVDKDTIFSSFKNLLEVVSLFCRQRTEMLGWDTEFGNRHEQVWKNPLDPLITKNVSRGRDKYLVDADFERLAGRAVASYAKLNADMRTVCADLLIGLTPFIDVSPPQRFLAMFQSLESCRRFAKNRNMVESQNQEDIDLISALSRAKLDASASVAERIDGFITRIEEPVGSLKAELECVLETWNVKTDDLWPLSGTKKLPGLIQLRDKLAHRGALALSFQGVAIASRHLSVLIERIMLALLDISIEETNAGVKVLGYEDWYAPSYVLEQRRLVPIPD